MLSIATIVVLMASILTDLALGAAALKLARTVEKNQHGHDLILVNHEERMKAMEARIASCSTR